MKNEIKRLLAECEERERYIQANLKVDGDVEEVNRSVGYLQCLSEVQNDLKEILGYEDEEDILHENRNY